MARPLRIEFSGALYHLTARGNAQQAIFIEDDDRPDFLKRLENVCHRYHGYCHAYCLMSNHYHLSVETQQPTLSKGMKHLNSLFDDRRGVGRVRWKRLTNQIYLGSDQFVEDMLSKLDPNQSLQDIPKSQKRSPPKLLSYYEGKYSEKKRAMAEAYCSGHYTLQQVGEHLRVKSRQIINFLFK